MARRKTKEKKPETETATTARPDVKEYAKAIQKMRLEAMAEQGQGPALETVQITETA